MFFFISNSAADDFLLLCEGGRKLCYFIPLRPPTPPHLHVTPLSILLDDTPRGISYDPTERRIYWTDTYGNINRAFLTGSSAEVLTRGHGSPKDIEIDLAGRNIYFADEYEDKIRVATLDVSYQAIILNVESPQGIALDSLAG